MPACQRRQANSARTPGRRAQDADIVVVNHHLLFSDLALRIEEAGFLRIQHMRIEQIGRYWVAREREMHDIAKDHRTRMIIGKATYDSGLSEEIFTTRYLER